MSENTDLKDAAEIAANNAVRNDYELRAKYVHMEAEFFLLREEIRAHIELRHSNTKDDFLLREEHRPALEESKAAVAEVIGRTHESIAKWRELFK